MPRPRKPEVTDLGRIALYATGLIDPGDLQDTGFIGGVIWCGDPATARRFDRALAARDGPLIALITGTPDAAHVVFERQLCIATRLPAEMLIFCVIPVALTQIDTQILAV